jgi:hypothetical protein
VCSSASAKDLPEKIAGIEAALNGTSLDRISNLYSRATSVSLTIASAQRALQAVGRGQQRADNDVGATWQQDDDLEAGKVRLSRTRDNRGGRAQFGDIEKYPAKVTVFTDASLVATAEAVVKHVAKEAKLLGSNEELRPDSTSFLRHEGGPAAQPGKTVTLGAMVIFRRYVDGVPVLGSRGEAWVMFDASDGALVELSLPRATYVRTARWEPSTQKGALLRSALNRKGLEVRAGARALRDLQGEHTAREFRCGYVDDEKSTGLKIGCDIALLKDTGSEDASVLIDGAERAPAALSADQTPGGN